MGALLVASLLVVAAAPAAASTLDRPEDPVVLTGASIPSMQGIAPGNLVAFRWTGQWEQIPVQVDERAMMDLNQIYGPGYSCSHGDPCYSRPPNGAVHLEYTDPNTWVGPDPDPTLDANDEVTFMAKDAGNKLQGTSEPSGVVTGTGLQVKATDPLDGGVGYVYLFRQDGSLDPGAGQQYVDYQFNLQSGGYKTTYNMAYGPNPETSAVTTPSYTRGFSDRWNDNDIRITRAGATGVDILDRHDDQFDRFEASCVRTQGTFKVGEGAFVINKSGPVRAIRDFVGSNSGPQTQREHIFYAGREDINTFLRVHPIPGVIDFFDYTPAATGMVYKSIFNTGGLLIDGMPDPFNPGAGISGQDGWESVDGPQGGLSMVHQYITDNPDPSYSTSYTDQASPPRTCGGDSSLYGASGPQAGGALNSTDEANGGTTHLFYKRVLYYEEPGQADGAARMAQFDSPLRSSVTAVPGAETSIPDSLKSSCTTITPASGYSYRYCNDGLPPSGGTTPNPDGTRAVEVPASYRATSGDDWTGLPTSAHDSSMAGADPDGNIALDADISIPTTPPPPGGYPLITFMHGCCSGDKTSWEATSFDAAGEKWHYSNAWFASRGYAVLNYTARGFVNGEQNGNLGSTGEAQLDSRRFEINDFQYLAGLLADDPFFDVDPQKVVTTGGSYGGGFSWMALTDPFWKSPDGVDMKLAAVAPKYGWTDLVDSLVPTGRHSQEPDDLPAFDGSDSSSPTGIPKKSINAALYDSGKTGIPPGSAHTTFPPYVDEATACLNSADPVETNPACTNTLQNTLPSFINDRSAYYQNQWFQKIATDPTYRIPIFNAATLTDPLFPPVEDRRMANRILSVVPDYPIQQYYGDYQHFVQNKDKEWGDICGANHHVCNFSDYAGGDLNATPNGLVRTGVTTRLDRFVDHYIQPSGNPSEPQPSFDVTASLQICPSNAPLEGVAADEPGPTFNAESFEALAREHFTVDATGTQVTTNDASPNNHATTSDPVANQVNNGKRCPVETTPAGPGVATYDSDPLDSDKTMIGATKVSIDYSVAPADATQGNFQLNSRLYDVFPDGSAVMVDRGVRRVTDPSGTVTYELHGNGWRFHSGHKIRIEIAQDDDPYAKASNVPSSATLTHVHLNIPVREPAYPRPIGASPLRVSLVPAFQPCETENAIAMHGSPLSFPSCGDPSPISSTVRVGPHSLGFARIVVCPANAASLFCTPPASAMPLPDVRLTGSIRDVKCAPTLPGGQSACSAPGADYNPNGAPGPYSEGGDGSSTPARPPCFPSGSSTSACLAGADLTEVAEFSGGAQGKGIRITDQDNGPLGDSPATVVNLAFPIPLDCIPTADASLGSTCGVNTTANALVPGVVKDGAGAVWQIGQIEIKDSGPDGVRGNSNDQVFEVQGVFLP